MHRAVLGVLLLAAVATAQTWLNWSEWDGSCNVKSGRASAQTRFRTCKLSADGTAAPCFGETTEVLPCEKCPLQGTWGEWSVMDGCSDACGAFGRRFRTRECKKPTGCPNVPCQGHARELEENGEPCDHTNPCLLPRKSCHPDYKMSVDMEETRTKCIKKVQE